jgi:hypothetical protein
MRRLRDAGKLTEAQRGCFVAPRAREELYDLEVDPHELVNLAGDPKYAKTISEMRSALAAWVRETGDLTPETLRPDEADRETGNPLVRRVRGR